MSVKNWDVFYLGLPFDICSRIPVNLSNKKSDTWYKFYIKITINLYSLPIFTLVFIIIDFPD
jgi:hypothetical protein